MPISLTKGGSKVWQILGLGSVIVSKVISSEQHLQSENLRSESRLEISQSNLRSRFEGDRLIKEVIGLLKEGRLSLYRLEGSISTLSSNQSSGPEDLQGSNSLLGEGSPLVCHPASRGIDRLTTSHSSIQGRTIQRKFREFNEFSSIQLSTRESFQNSFGPKNSPKNSRQNF